ncbi:MAG: recombinase family protein [Nanoarchaeota archaeon]
MPPGNYSIARLEKELYEAGLRTRSGGKLGMSRIHTLLQDTFYHGKIRWVEKTYPGKHEPLITKDTFDAVQNILRRKTKNPHHAKHISLFRSKIFCENCNGMMTWYTKKGHWYGHCNNHGVYSTCPKKTCMREEAVEAQIVDIFDVIAPKTEEVLEAIVQILKDQHGDKVIEREGEVRRINSLLTNVRTQKDRLYEAKLNKEVPADYVERKLSELGTDEQALEDTLIAVSDKSDEYQAAGIAVHELAFRSKQIYEIADTDKKRLLMSQLFTNLLQNGLEIKKNYTSAAQFLLEWIPKLNKDYELAKSKAIKGKEVVFATSSPNWLPG